MGDADLTGHDGPYAAPLPLPGGTVQSDWIDYNGHMNVAYYTMAFDRAIDAFLEDHVGNGESFAARVGMGPYALQTSYHYLAELHEAEAFAFRLLLIDHDAKRMHLCVEMSKGGDVVAVCETLLMNVDLTARRLAPYPERVLARLARMAAAHDAAPRPGQVGARIGIRRK